MKKIKTLIVFSIICIVVFVFLLSLITESKNYIKTPIGNQKLTKSQPLTNIQKVQFIIKGSIPYWDQESAFFTFKENIAIFSYINLFWYYLNPDGTIVKYSYAKEDKSIIDFAHDNNVKVFAVVANLPEYEGSSWDSKRVENVITHADTKNTHIDNIVNKLDQLNFDGVTIDYEEVDGRTKDEFSIFIKELASVLHKNEKILAVALHPKTTDFGNGEFQDWEVLAKFADQLNIMAYGDHWDESSAGPIASIKWVEKIIEYAKSLGIPSEKFILGIPLYGYDWNKNDKKKATGLTFKDVQNLLAEFDAEEHWDSEFAAPYFLYNDQEGAHEVWFENARSVKAKKELAKKAGFAGVTFWRLGGEDSDIWKIIGPLR